MLKLDDAWPESDAVPWCSAFVNYICWLLRLPRSKSLRARSWLEIGTPYSIPAAQPGFDVVVFSRGALPQPGPDVINAPGHVGFYAGLDRPDATRSTVLVLGGNQADGVNISRYPTSRVLGIRRLL
jgi:uncharacterized protein (TIGR02594 family)